MNKFIQEYKNDLFKFDSILAFFLSLVLFYNISNYNLKLSIKYSITFVVVFLLILNYIQIYD